MQLQLNLKKKLFISECEALLCDFHREQSWTRWVSKLDNGVSNIKEDVLSMLRRCAHANTEAEYKDAVTKLQSSHVWTSNHRLRDWFGKT